MDIRCRYIDKHQVLEVIYVSRPGVGAELTWLLMLIGFPSRSPKLLLPRLLEGPPLTEGPGPSLPERSVRIRMGPLVNAGLREEGFKTASWAIAFREAEETAKSSVRVDSFTGRLLCSCCPRSSSHALHPDPSDGLTCSASWLWLPCGVRAWKRVSSLPCLCGPCRGVQPGRNEEAPLCGLTQNSLGSARSRNCLCEVQDAVSFLLARHQTGYV